MSNQPKTLGDFKALIPNREEAEKAYYKYKKREWYLQNKEKSIAQATEWRRNNLERWKEAQQEWRNNNPDRVRVHGAKSHLKSRLQKYDLTPEQYDSMFQRQKGVCAICQEPEQTGRRLAIDHDHQTGKVRELLCTRCNVTLGFIERVQQMRFKLRPFLRYQKKHQM